MLHDLARRTAMMVPAIRRLHDRARRYDQITSNQSGETGQPETHPQAVAAKAVRRAVAAMLKSAEQFAWFQVHFNGYDCWLPAGTLRTMSHCYQLGTAGLPQLLVETEHLNWMISKLAPGGTFLDVGAATGATTLPIAMKFGSKVAVSAFEPANTARELLVNTLRRNRVEHVEVFDCAVSNFTGNAEFMQYGYDETDQTPFLPEASRLTATSNDTGGSKYSVPVISLDSRIDAIKGSPTVIKIDVEGFECLVLDGAQSILRMHRPYLSIDIHQDPFDPTQMTEGNVRAILERFGYTFEKNGHVLLCTPKAGS